MRKVESIDDLSVPEFRDAWFEFFGTRRGVQLFGYCTLWAVTGALNDLPAYRRQLIEAGLSRSAAYEALQDLRLFREWVEGCSYSPSDGRPIFGVMEQVVRLNASVQFAG